jgi:hypothetical protein
MADETLFAPAPLVKWRADLNSRRVYTRCPLDRHQFSSVRARLLTAVQFQTSAKQLQSCKGEKGLSELR